MTILSNGSKVTTLDGNGVTERDLWASLPLFAFTTKGENHMAKIAEIFGSNVFSDAVMKERLPNETYRQVQRTIQTGKRLDDDAARIVANAMKDWAIEKGCTHFTHWFQPMTGVTAEKHDSFISPTDQGHVIMEFSGKELVRGEPDASSFPSGGLRATFEARGYTAWDPTSYAFIKENVLCIPTAFCSYGGEALDKKTPLLRSVDALNREGLRLVKLFGMDDVKRIVTTVGPEQEYFLVDKEVFNQREDLIYTGRTLFGAKPPKGQELDDHYFGSIKPRVQAFMNDLDEELWKLGVLAKTEHNEAAPAQHELAPIFTNGNLAADHNQITMETLQRVASRHGMVCLLHEKPFAGVNGSGKHNNWSMGTDTGVNLLEPGETPAQNALFLLCLCAVIQAVDDYQDMLRISVASASNDHRLGAYEAPPAVISMFLGTELSEILDAIESGTAYVGKEREQLKIGVHALPRFPKDTTDRNRTSPFAFTGNKFEFRAPGSSASISGVNVVLNTAVAESLRQYADALEGSEDFESDLQELIRRVIREHKRIIFNGNGYDDHWLAEAEKRGLLNLRTTPDALPYYVADKNVELFTRHRVYTRTEMEARYEIHLEHYCKVLNIEALTMIDMSRRFILPAVSRYIHELSDTALAIQSLTTSATSAFEQEQVAEMSGLLSDAFRKTKNLDAALFGAKNVRGGSQMLADYYRDHVLAAMQELRISVDQLETMTPSDVWPFPSYGDLLFSVK